jgi:hypothetical protein
MSTYSTINLGTPFETDQLDNIYQALQLIPDNTGQMISPKDVRDLVYTSYKEGEALILNAQVILFRQDTPQEIWTIYHTTERRPSVAIYDDNFFLIEPLVQHIDNTTIKIYFNQPLSGWVIG